MPMAGIVTKTGADLIVQARKLVERIGRPLELDTDGIWCILPRSFPDVYMFKTADGDKFKLEYPCVMLNADVHDKFTNHQYQTLMDPAQRKYETRSENSIFFEVDGPYRAMIIPASTEEGKLLKKRYAVFNEDGSLAELKGFELKRRGELELIKTFQSQIFERFLDGTTLVECYDSVAEVANHWMDVIDTRGESLDTDELVDLISENRSMSKKLEEYGDRKGTSQTTAHRLGEFLGAEITKDKGLNCKFIIAERPHGAPVTERAIPTAIWKAEPAVTKHFLRRWLKSPGMEEDDFDIRTVLDRDYYRERLGKTIQKIVTIPAALQMVPNPVPRVPHPEWLERTVRRLNDRHKQRSITSMFGPAVAKKRPAPDRGSTSVADMEDAFDGGSKGPGRPVVHRRRTRTTRGDTNGRSVDSHSKPEIAETAGNKAAAPYQEKGSSEKIALSKEIPNEDFKKWLQRKKSLWRDVRKERRKLARGTDGVNTGKGTDSRSSSSLPQPKRQRTVGSMAGYLRDAAISLYESEWHVIEVREISSTEGGSIGEFVLWVMVGNTLQKVNVTVPRTVYVDCLGKMLQQRDGKIEVKHVERHLPHNKVSRFLYEVTMSENDFRHSDWMKSLIPLDQNVTGQLVHSVYGMGTPLMLRALMDIGCVSRIDSSLNENRSGKSFILSDLKQVAKPEEGEYLHSNLTYKRIFFYESLHPNTETGLLAVFIIEGNITERDRGDVNDTKLDLTSSCHLWVVKPGAARGQKKHFRSAMSGYVCTNSETDSGGALCRWGGFIRLCFSRFIVSM